MSRIRPRYYRERKALPPLWGKDVELLEITPQVGTPLLWHVRLRINGEPYKVTMYGKDELTIMQRIFKMQETKPRSVFHAS